MAGGCGSKIARCANLPALEIDFPTVDRRARRMRSTKRRTGRQRCDHLNGLDVESSSGVARRIASCDHQPAHRCLLERGARDLTQRPTQNGRVHEGGVRDTAARIGDYVTTGPQVSNDLANT